jgi:hypothetical protein
MQSRGTPGQGKGTRGTGQLKAENCAQGRSDWQLCMYLRGGQAIKVLVLDVPSTGQSNETPLHPCPRSSASLSRYYAPEYPEECIIDPLSSQIFIPSTRLELARFQIVASDPSTASETMAPKSAPSFRLLCHHLLQSIPNQQTPSGLSGELVIGRTHLSRQELKIYPTVMRKRSVTKAFPAVQPHHQLSRPISARVSSPNHQLPLPDTP